MWNDSPNNLFESSCLTESDLKHFCFGDSGGEGEAVDAASDMGIASAGAMGVGPAASSEGGISEFSDPRTPGARTTGAAIASLAEMGFENPAAMVNPGIINVGDIVAENTLASHQGGMRPGMLGLSPDMVDMTGFGPVSGRDISTLGAHGFSPVGYQTGIGRGQLADYASSIPAIAAADKAAGYGPAPAVGSWNAWDAITDVLALVPGPIGWAGTVVDTITGPRASRGALASLGNATIGPAATFDAFGQSGLGQDASGLGESLGAEEGNKHGGMVGKKAGGLTSIKRAQSGGNIGGLSSIGPNLIDVINQGIAMPKNIGTIQRQDKLDINQSNPYGNR